MNLDNIGRRIAVVVAIWAAVTYWLVAWLVQVLR